MRPADCTIRLATPDDAAAIKTVHETAIRELTTSAYTAEEAESWAAGLSPEHYVRCMIQNGETFLVMESGQRVIGFSAFKGDELTGLYIAPGYAGRGLGHRLLRDAETRIRTAGVATIKVEASKSAQKFYEVNGYETLSFKRSRTRGGLMIEIVMMESRSTHL